MSCRNSVAAAVAPLIAALLCVLAQGAPLEDEAYPSREWRLERIANRTLTIGDRIAQQHSRASEEPEKMQRAFAAMLGGFDRFRGRIARTYSNQHTRSKPNLHSSIPTMGSAIAQQQHHNPANREGYDLMPYWQVVRALRPFDQSGSDEFGLLDHFPFDRHE